MTLNQGTTTGTGIGARFTASFGLIAANANLATLATGGNNYTNGNMFWGASTPHPRMGGAENTFIGCKSGGGFAGSTTANTSLGHNALGSGDGDPVIGGTGGTCSGSYNTGIGNDAGRNITGTANANTLIGQNAGRMMSGSQNTFIGAGAGTASWSTPFSGSNNTLIGFQVGAATLLGGFNNVLIGTNNLTDTTSLGGANVSNVFGIGGQNGLWMSAVGTDGIPSLRIGAYCGALGSGSFAFGFGASALNNNYCAFAFGQDVTSDANHAHARGYKAHTAGRYGVDVFATGQFSAAGDAQNVRCVMRGTGAGTSAIRLTGDGNAAAGSNVLNMPNNHALAVAISVVAMSTTTPGKNIAWINATGLLTRVTGTTSLSMAATPTPISNGTVTGAGVAFSADTTNGGINISFTPPTSNTDTWHIVARIEAAEVG